MRLALLTSALCLLMATPAFAQSNALRADDAASPDHLGRRMAQLEEQQAQSEQGVEQQVSSLQQQVADLNQTVSDLDQRVAQLEGQPDEQAAQRRARAQALGGALERLAQIQSALALGQTDVVQAIEDVQGAVDSAARGLGQADQLQLAHARAALAALGDAADAVGREDLFNARGAIDLASLELARARDADLAH